MSVTRLNKLPRKRQENYGKCRSIKLCHIVLRHIYHTCQTHCGIQAKFFVNGMQNFILTKNELDNYELLIVLIKKKSPKIF